MKIININYYNNNNKKFKYREIGKDILQKKNKQQENI